MYCVDGCDSVCTKYRQHNKKANDARTVSGSNEKLRKNEDQRMKYRDCFVSPSLSISICISFPPQDITKIEHDKDITCLFVTFDEP